MLSRIIGTLLVLAGFGIMIWFGIIYAFINPELTDTQRLVNTWPWTIIFILLVAMGFGIASAEE